MASGRGSARRTLSTARLASLALALAACVAAALIALPHAAAQSWPSKPVKVIAAFPAGGSVDQVARVLAQQLSVQTGQ